MGRAGGGGAEAWREGAVTGSPVRAADASGEEAVERGSADAGEEWTVRGGLRG